VGYKNSSFFIAIAPAIALAMVYLKPDISRGEEKVELKERMISEL
jgi:hypothetical protein